MQPASESPFSFRPIVSVAECISVNLFEENKADPLGSGTIKLERLKDQKKHDDALELKNPAGKTVGVLHLTLQWIYSRVKFLADVVRKWDDTIHEDEVAMHELEQKIQDLRAPFQNTLEAVVQSVGIEHQIFMTHQMYPEEYDIKECLLFFWYTVAVLALVQMFIKQDFTSVCFFACVFHMK